jgi:hypothetical protein
MDDEALEAHFHRIRERYKSGRSGGNGMEEVPQPELEQNELTAKYRKK